MSVLPSADQKAAYVNRMFDGIAQRYDLLNRLMTLGQDVRWRELLVHAATLPAGGRLLDIATGGINQIVALQDEAVATPPTPR